MLRFLITYVFMPKHKRTEQMRLDWNWFWRVDLLDWWQHISPFPTRAYHPKDPDDDNIPF